jgi:hypothetical protein
VTNTSQNASPGRGLINQWTPLRYAGGWSAVPVMAGPANQGAGGGGGGAGSAGDGLPGGQPPPYGQPGGPGGPPDGGQGAGGRSPFVDGAGNNGTQPGGGGGGVTRRTTNLPTIYGARGANGKIAVTYLRSQQKMQTLLLHMPNPDSEATFVPVINLGDGAMPPDEFDPAARYSPVSPHPGMQVSYNGTYTVALTAGFWDPAWPARTLKVFIQQIGLSGTYVEETELVWENLVPRIADGGDWMIDNGLVPMGSVTLPLRWLPPDNQDTVYVVRVSSKFAGGPNAGAVTGDRFLDLLLLDVTGTTVGLIDPGGVGAGYTTWFVDEPESGQSFGGILGSNYGRTGAVSATNSIVSVSGGPFMIEPGRENLLLAYTAQQVSADVATQPDPPATVPAGAAADDPDTDTWVMAGGFALYPGPAPFDVYDPDQPTEFITVTDTTTTPGSWAVTRDTGNTGPVAHAPGFTVLLTQVPPDYQDVWRPLALAADYYPRWWFDRADDLLALGQDPVTAAARRRGLPPPASRMVVD